MTLPEKDEVEFDPSQMLDDLLGSLEADRQARHAGPAPAAAATSSSDSSSGDGAS
jgi:hypothetical protein